MSDTRIAGAAERLWKDEVEGGSDAGAPEEVEVKAVMATSVADGGSCIPPGI